VSFKNYVLFLLVTAILKISLEETHNSSIRSGRTQYHPPNLRCAFGILTEGGAGHIWKEFNFVSQAVKRVEVTCNFLLFEYWRIDNWKNFRLSLCLLLSLFYLLPLFMHNLLNILGIYNSFSLGKIETVN
jgi:hypothetical protein